MKLTDTLFAVVLLAVGFQLNSAFYSGGGPALDSEVGLGVQAWLNEMATAWDKAADMAPQSENGQECHDFLSEAWDVTRKQSFSHLGENEQKVLGADAGGWDAKKAAELWQRRADEARRIAGAKEDAR